MFTEEQIKSLLANWSVDEEQTQQFIDELKASETKDVQNSEVEEGGEPTPNEDDDKKVETEEVAKTEEGGEPTEEEKVATDEVDNVQEVNDAQTKRIDALEARIADLVSTLEGLSAANKRNEEIIGSLGKKVNEKPAPFGDINSTEARNLKAKPEEEVKKTMDFLGELAGKR